MAGGQRYLDGRAYGRSCTVRELWEEEEEDEEEEVGSVKKNIMTYVKPWMSERRTLYSKLDKMADDLHDLHIKSSGAMLLGVAACAGGFLMNLFAEKNKWENVGAVSRAVAVGGGMAVVGIELFQELEDFVALKAAKTEFKGHKETFYALKQKAKDACISDGPDLDDSALRRPYSTTALRCTKRPELFDTLENISSLLMKFHPIFERLPTFFKSWETMNGSVVPETVKRIRDLKEELQELEDELMVNLLSYFSQS